VLQKDPSHNFSRARSNPSARKMAKGLKVPKHVLNKRKTMEAVAAKKVTGIVVTRAANTIERKSIFLAAKNAQEYQTADRDLQGSPPIRKRSPP